MDIPKFHLVDFRKPTIQARKRTLQSQQWEYGPTHIICQMRALQQSVQSNRLHQSVLRDFSHAIYCYTPNLI